MKTEHGDLNHKLASAFADLQVNWAATPASPGVGSDVSGAIVSAAEAKRSAMLARALSKRLEEVDKQFVRDEYKFHTKMVKTLEKFSDTKSERLKIFLNESGETFKRHIMHAEMLATALGLGSELGQMKA